LPNQIVDAARALLDPEALKTEQFLSDIRARRTEAERTLAKARDIEREAKQVRRLANDALREAEDARRTAREEALQQAEAELAELRDLSRRLERQQSVGVQERREPEVTRKDLDSALQAVRDFRRVHVAPVRLAESNEIKAGDRVRIVAFDEEGDVLTVEDGFADVQMGSIKIRQPLDALKRTGRAPVAVTSEKRTTKPAALATVPIEVDFRGYRAHEIEAELLPWLEQAYRSGAPYVRVIHGKGTGALRQVVNDLLKSAPEVARFELAGASEGGDGATVAFLQER
jgi:DNA mismatch repair protein MutS2